MKIKFIILTISILFVVGFSCQKPTTVTIDKVELGETTFDSITYFSAHVSTTIIDLHNNDLTQHGHCWSTEKAPTVQNFKTTLGTLSQPTTYTSQITDLNENTVYYIRPYTTFNNQTEYGQEYRIKTLNVGSPMVGTSEVINISSYTAECGGVIFYDSGFVITSRGLCWDTTSNFTILNCIDTTIVNGEIGSFSSIINNLQRNTKYYVAAYATNEEGTSYGQVKEFYTEDATCGVLTVNYEGQTYNTIKIGSQCWFKENLNYQTGNSWCYDNNLSNCSTYGRLYDWETIMNGEASSNNVPSNVQGICPAGWHLPSDNEWKILEGNADTEYGVGNQVWDEEGYRGYDAGKRLKTTFGWSSNQGTDAVGFSALPGGFRYQSGSFVSLFDGAHWWTATEHNSENGWSRFLSVYENTVSRNNYEKTFGFNVRCLKN